jgi:CDP-diacylglycerol--glycerol-3-phosphate 3-phosphatidyltransferase
MNLPNALSIARIAATPLIAWMPFVESWPIRLGAFFLFLAAAITDYIDGHLARTRKLETDLGRLLDPAADKALLVGMMIPMYLLAPRFPYLPPFLGPVGLPLWVVVVVIGREVFMTVFRQVAKRRGVVISAIWAAKVKAVFQFIWQGSAYFWFFTVTAAGDNLTKNPWVQAWAWTNSIVGTVSMAASVFLTIYSLVLYMRSFGRVLESTPT